MTPQLPRWLDGVSETAVQRLRLQVQDITGRLLLRVLPKVRLPKVLVRLPETLLGSVVTREVTETVHRALLSVRPMFIAAAETEKALAALPKSHLRRLTVMTVRCPKGVLLLVVRIPDHLPGARYDRYLVMPSSAATRRTMLITTSEIGGNAACVREGRWNDPSGQSESGAAGVWSS